MRIKIFTFTKFRIFEEVKETKDILSFSFEVLYMI